MKDLVLQDVSMSFRDATVVRDIDLSIRQGEFVTLIGHSGCGKSTLINLIAGLLRPTTGTITLGGRPIVEPGPDRGVVFQHHSLFPWLTVFDNVLVAVESVHSALPKQERRRIVDEFLRKVGLYEHRGKKPHQLSGGMKQRVAIARTLAVNPDVLLLDEPFGSLDALTKNTMHEELLAMWEREERRQTILMVTHDIDEAIYLSNRVVVMTNGPRATIGAVSEVPIPRPRDKRAVLHTNAWLETKEYLLQLLTETYRLNGGETADVAQALFSSGGKDGGTLCLADAG
ncbi:MAG TPA: ABC transporter ATP-binding protein [Pirellulales bacterium]|nr:ABC transporter ATP-binding protein [Pirellulales bacterium]